MRAVRQGFLSVNAQIHPTIALATYPDSPVRAPDDQKAQTFLSRQISGPASPVASNQCVRRESDGRGYRTRSKCFRLHFGTSTFPVDRAEAHREQRGCE